MRTLKHHSEFVTGLDFNLESEAEVLFDCDMFSMDHFVRMQLKKLCFKVFALQCDSISLKRQELQYQDFRTLQIVC